MSKYDPLAAKLKSLRSGEWHTSFADLERMLGFRLPNAARSYRAWWSNNDFNNVMTKVWLKAGWRTEQVDMADETLVFKKAKSGPNEVFVTGKSLFGALAGTVRIAPKADIVGPSGERWNADRG